MRSTDGGVVHWDEVGAGSFANGDMRGTRRRLAGPAGADRVGLSRYELPARARSMPVHTHADEEELFFILAGSGVAWLDGTTFDVSAGDCIAHLAGGAPHTLLAGADGLDVLAFGSGSSAHLTYLPRPRVFWAGAHWLPADGPHPFKAEAACGPLELPPSTSADRPASIVALRDVPPEFEDRTGYRGSERNLGAAVGSLRSGLRHALLDAHAMSCPPHWHSGEEELFVILEGTGELLLLTNELLETRTALRAGHVVARPAGTGVAHALLGGEQGMTYLAYGTRHANEVVYYPRSRKAFLGQILARVDPVADYWDGEV